MGAGSRGPADHQAAIRHGLGEILDHHGVGQDVLGAVRTPIGLHGGKLVGPDQVEPPKVHDLHRARGGSDVAGMPGLYQDDADVVECHAWQSTSPEPISRRSSLIVFLHRSQERCTRSLASLVNTP